MQAEIDKLQSLMVDVAVNAMGYLQSDKVMDFSEYNPFNDQKYFHPYCNITDYANQTNSQQVYFPLM